MLDLRCPPVLASRTEYKRARKVKVQVYEKILAALESAADKENAKLAKALDAYLVGTYRNPATQTNQMATQQQPAANTRRAYLLGVAARLMRDTDIIDGAQVRDILGAANLDANDKQILAAFGAGFQNAKAI